MVSPPAASKPVQEPDETVQVAPRDVDTFLDDSLQVQTPRPQSTIRMAGPGENAPTRTITMKIEEAAIYGAGTVVLLVLA